MAGQFAKVNYRRKPMLKSRFDIVKGRRIISHIWADDLSPRIESLIKEVGYLVIGPYLVKK